MVGGPSLPIPNVPWRVPSVDPKHFTVEQFQSVINSIGAVSQLDFLWLDVACLDFSDVSVGLDDGIVMQREIFGSASQNFIWLSQLDGKTLSTILKDLDEIITLSLSTSDDGSRHTDMSSFLGLKVLPTMRELLKDPWFTSLWTLQEAMVNPDAILLCRNGDPVGPSLGLSKIYQDTQTVKLTYGVDTSAVHTLLDLGLPTCGRDKTSQQLHYATLLYVSCASRVILSYLDSPQLQNSYHSDLHDLRSLIQEKGLAAFINFNVLKLTELARRRARAHPQGQLEHIYRSVLGHTFAKRPSEKLDDEAFAWHLIKHFPISAHIFVRPSIHGEWNTWLYTSDCMHPDIRMLLQCFPSCEPLLRTSLKSGSSTACMGFMGFASPFSSTITHLLERRSKTRLLGICFDRSTVEISGKSKLSIPMMTALPQCRFETPQVWHVDTQEQARVIVTFKQIAQQGLNNTKLLILACSSNVHQKALSVAIGLIICQVSEHVWQRLGWCFWIIPSMPDDVEMLDNVSIVGKRVGLDDMFVSGIEGEAL
jgi:hypothetical protein